MASAEDSKDGITFCVAKIQHETLIVKPVDDLQQILQQIFGTSGTVK